MNLTNYVAVFSTCTEDVPVQPRQKLDKQKKPTDMEESGAVLRILHFVTAVDLFGPRPPVLVGTTINNSAQIPLELFFGLVE